MVRIPLITRGAGSALAMAFALAAGGIAGTVATTAPALAQQQPNYSPSRNFSKVYQPIAAIANAAGGDYASAKAQLPALVAAVENADDRYLAGNLHYALGVKLNDQTLQQQGMEMMLASGKAAPAAVAEMNYFLGEWAYNASQWAKARQYLAAAKAAGYTEGNVDGLTVESYIKEGQVDQGLTVLDQLIQERTRAGQEVPEQWIRRGVRIAVEARNLEQIGKWSGMLLAASPTPETWGQVLAVVSSLETLDRDSQLDMLRLMALTNSLKTDADYKRYIATADPRAMSNEAGRILQAAVQAGAISTGDSYYTDVKAVVDNNAGKDRADAPTLAAEARAASGTARDAQNAGDVFLSLESWAEAEQMFALGLQKPGADRDLFLTRLGIAQARQGKNAEAKATFAQVSGQRAAVARLWSAYIDSRA